MKDILEDIETRMFALDRALPDNSAARDLLEILHRSQVEIGKLRTVIKGLGMPHCCGGAIKPGRESCTRCGAEEDATELRSPIAPAET